MKHLHSKTIVACVLFAVSSASMLLRAQQAVPDLILTNGKIITVDERFTIAQAVALKGERFMAVGANQEIAGLAGPNTKKIDLRGRAVVPGLIDNHNAFHAQRRNLDGGSSSGWHRVA